MGRGGASLSLPSSISTSAVAFIVHIFHIFKEYFQYFSNIFPIFFQCFWGITSDTGGLSGTLYKSDAAIYIYIYMCVCFSISFFQGEKRLKSFSNCNILSHSCTQKVQGICEICEQ